MQTYIKHIKSSYKLRFSCLAFQLFLFFEAEELNEKREIDLSSLRYAIKSSSWCKSEYMKLIFKQTNKYLKIFEQDLLVSPLKPYYQDYFKTILMMEQFFTLPELETFIQDNETLADTIVDYASSRSDGGTPKESHNKAMAQFSSFLQKLPSRKESFHTLLMELPFQLFVLVAAADKDLDNKERAEFLRIMNTPEWCQSESTRSFFTNTSQNFSEYLLRFQQGEFSRSLNQVNKTVSLIDKMFQKEEAVLIKTDFSRLTNEIAKASGGLKGLLSVSKAERDVIAGLKISFGDSSQV